MATLKVNGTDIATLSLAVVELANVWSRPRREREWTPVMGRLLVRPALTWTTRAKVIRMTLAMSATVAARRAALDNVFRLFAEGSTVTLVWDDATARSQYGEVLVADVRGRFDGGGYGFVKGDLAIMVEIMLYSPLSFTTVAKVVTLTAATPAACAVGTAPSFPLVELNGAIAAAVTVKYRDHDANLISELAVANPAIGVGEKLVIDSATERIWKLVGSTYTAVMNLYTSGEFPVIDPADAGDVTEDEWPTLETSAAGTATYYEAWE